MFKKLKDKLAEEVKSSPQRIQQFAQAAQAAVTSASSSISDITNTDLFSIGDNESQHSRSVKADMSPVSQKNTFQDVALVQPSSLQASTESVDYASSHDLIENQRQRRLSNSSFASDVSFRLPSYESPSMYHLQSDMDVSASEAEDRGISGGAVSLDRVTKEQLYAAYRRTQERYTKYRTQYADLARHYKLLERENAKARSVLVETQDKALRRISELREQCSLEQSAKAHLEKALRVDLEERNMKIETLNTKILLLQNKDGVNLDNKTDNEAQLINLSIDNDNESKQANEESSENILLNNKIEKLEQLLKKYKESLKVTKEKNSQLMSELQIVSSELENKSEEYEQQKDTIMQLNKAREQIQELNDLNEELQNKINSYDFSKTKEISTLEIDLQKAQEEIEQLRSKIEVFTKREEEYAISLAENKLSIHKELESKENEIKSLKNSLSASVKEIQSLNIVVSDYKNTISKLEEERTKLNSDFNELNLNKRKIAELESQLVKLTQKCESLENSRTKVDEEFRCLQLQLKQETAEKLAMIDRNRYLEDKNTQISEENARKSLQISNLDNKLQMFQKDRKNSDVSEEAEKIKMLQEIDTWKSKYSSLESEIQEERVELVKLQTEIEKLLANHELIQIKNTELQSTINALKSEKSILQEKYCKNNKIKTDCEFLLSKIRDLKEVINVTSKETTLLKQMNNSVMPTVIDNVNILLNNTWKINDIETIKATCDKLQKDNFDSHIKLKEAYEKIEETSSELLILQKENEELKTDSQTKESEMIQIKEQIATILNSHNLLQKETNELKEQLEKTSCELNLLYQENKDSKTEIQVKESELIQIKEQLTKTLYELDLLHQENKKLKTEIQSKESEVALVTKRIAEASNELDLLHEENKELKAEIQAEKSEVVLISEQITESSKKLNVLCKENKELIAKMKAEELELQNLRNEYGIALNELQSIKEEKQLLISSIDKSESKYQLLQDTVESDKEQQSVVKIKAEAMEQEVQSLIKNNNKIADENVLLCKEIDTLRKEHEGIIIKLDAIKKENEALVNNTKIIEDDKNRYIEKLEENIQIITQENISLKSQSENIAKNVRQLESEISEVKKSHVEMETEKERLNSILEKLESNEKQHNLIKQDKNSSAKDGTHQEIELFEEVTSHLSEPLQCISSDNEILQDSTDLNEHFEKLETLKNQYNSQKEENRRLLSDISGLQTHLAKISKENSVLNDKLRELIASSENSPHRNELLSSDTINLKNEFQSEKEKLEDLTRENTLLIEENLELKDQLNSHNYIPTAFKPTRDDEKDNQLLEKYNNLLATKNNLEKKIMDLECMNNLINGNMILIQENNEKLKLSNEKLERRLDEALVSLRHLHSLQENTELEYLRNILYEYLTGSGTHSITLAKVLAAVVKFSDTQTQQVLQKERERQGVLRQLGLL